MNAMRSTWRPKHQSLVLKCYPKFQKNAVDVKPNASELSYLVFYATSRRSKLQKVGDYLEKKTQTDIYRQRLWNVQITLQIFKALIEKSPRDLPLFAPNVLTVLTAVIHSNDLTIIEESVSLFESFCSHQDSTLVANQDYVRRFEHVIRDYCEFATKAKSLAGSSPYAELRWQSVSLNAVKCVASSSALGTNFGRQLEIIMPVILQTLFQYPEDSLADLQHRPQLQRTSTANELVRTKSAATVAEPDKLEKDDVGILAIQSLQKIFEANNRGQIRMGTGFVLRFITGHAKQMNGEGGWATTMIDMIARWAPTQDGHLILVVLLETLAATVISQATFSNQFILVTLIGWLLSSRVNLIGLSVMDILLGLLSHMLSLLSWTSEDEPVVDGKDELLRRMVNCIGDLATHIYYSDQISDMVASVLLRVKPNDTETQSPADFYFTTPEARLAALAAVKETLTVANIRHGTGPSAVVNRNKIDIKVFDGTHWLLNDDVRVRNAYVDVLLTWMRYEIDRDAGKVADHSAIKPGTRKDSDATLARRAVSKAKPKKSNFLRHIHLAIYDHALAHADVEAEVSLLHLLVTSLLDKFGVNAAVEGLPMIMRLQEDIQVVESPGFKIGLGTICHGYFWALSKKFSFSNSDVGMEIDEEIARRKGRALWVESVAVPALQLDQLASVAAGFKDYSLVESESLIPFDNRPGMVDLISNSYGDTILSPISSPPTSPMRVFTGPILSVGTKELPLTSKDELLGEWTREEAIRSTSESRKTSLNGSKGTNRSAKQFLGVRGSSAAPSRNNSLHNLQMTGLEKFRRTSLQNSPQTSSHGSTMRVNDLKKYLAGETVPDVPDSSSDSMVTAEESSPSVSDNEGIELSPPIEITLNIPGVETADQAIMPPPPRPDSQRRSHEKRRSHAEWNPLDLGSLLNNIESNKVAVGGVGKPPY